MIHARGATVLFVFLFGASPLGARTQGSEHRTLSLLQAAHPYSVPGPITTTPDGNWLFVAEAGVLAVIDATDQDSYEQPEKIVPISSYGVRAVEIALDPDAAAAEEPTDPENVLYVAGGRHGL